MPAWAQPYAQGYLQQAHTVANQPHQAYGGSTVAGFTPWQQQGYTAMAQRAADGSPLMGNAQQSLQGMFSGQPQGATANPQGQVTPGQNQYAGMNNPYLQGQVDLAQGDLARNWNQVQMPAFDTAMSRSGSFGNSNVQSMASQGASDLQRNMGDISSRMRFQDYSQQQQLAENAVNRGMQASMFNGQMGESFAGRNDAMSNSSQNRMLQALGMAPQFAREDYNDIDRLVSAGGSFQNQNQTEMNDAYRRFTEQRDHPQRQVDAFGRALGNVNPGSTTTNSGPNPSSLATGLGGALTFAQLWNLIGGGG